MQVEFALAHNMECNVASLDLKKAFNLLSRIVLRNTGAHFGVPDSVTVLHQSFLSGLQRHFRILNNVTRGVDSITGVPEGCGFSVCCMMQLNWLVTAKLQLEPRLSEQAQHFSYVDNWLFMSACGQKIRNSISVTEAFAAQAGYVISPGKTWISSTLKKVRNGFRTLQVAGARVSTPVFLSLYTQKVQRSPQALMAQEQALLARLLPGTLKSMSPRQLYICTFPTYPKSLRVAALSWIIPDMCQRDDTHQGRVVKRRGSTNSLKTPHQGEVTSARLTTQVQKDEITVAL